jgi:hypothetical protein
MKLALQRITFDAWDKYRAKKKALCQAERLDV